MEQPTKIERENRGADSGSALFGVIVQAGTDPESGRPRLTIETTEQQLRDLAISPYGKQCRVEVLEISVAPISSSDLLACAEIGKRWRENSSLEEWFPFAAQKLKSLEAEVGNSAGILVIQNRVIRRLAGELVAAIERCNELTPDDQIKMLVPSVDYAIGAAREAG